MIIWCCYRYLIFLNQRAQAFCLLLYKNFPFYKQTNKDSLKSSILCFMSIFSNHQVLPSSTFRCRDLSTVFICRKSTFFNVLTKSQAAAENFPFCTIDPNESRVPIPDERYDFLCQFHKPARYGVSSFTRYSPPRLCRLMVCLLYEKSYNNAVVM